MSTRVPDCERWDHAGGYCIEGKDCTCNATGSRAAIRKRGAYYVWECPDCGKEGEALTRNIARGEYRNHRGSHATPDRAAKSRRGLADDSADPVDSERLARMFQSMAKRRVHKWIMRDTPSISADDLVSAAWEYIARYKPKYMGHAVKLGAWGMSAEYWRMRDGRRNHFEDEQPLHIGAWQPDPVFDRPQGDALPLLDSLTNREAQVALLTAMGYGPSEIGERLGISEVTVHANTSRARLKVLGETSKRRRGMGSAGAQHGTSSMYTHGCRCPECRRAQADHMRTYRERKRAQRDGADATKGYRR